MDALRRRRPDLDGAGAVAAGIGMTTTLVVMVLLGFPPFPIGPFSPAYLLGPLGAAGAVQAWRRRPELTLLAAFVATVVSGVTLAIAAPAWAVLEFLECWASWLSDC